MDNAEKEFRRSILKTKKESITTNDRICGSCVHFYETKNNGVFTPMCSLTTDIDLRNKEQALNQLPPEQSTLYKSMADPVYWAAVNLRLFDRTTSTWKPWTPRWYQIAMLRCTSKLSVARCGRQIGKSEVLCIKMLHAALTNKHYRVVLVCPNKVQVGEIFKRMRLYLQESPTISPPVRDIKNPELLEFENGSTIQGFQVGGESGTGDQLRGQSPNKVFVDEVDTLSDDAFDALTPYLNAHPDTTLMACSTPRKFGGRFYQACMDKQLGYKEFKFPSSVSPSWSKEMEYYYRRINPANVYAQEYEAEFADVSAGVYRKVDIDNSLYDYDPNERVFDHSRVYTMGVDWNGDGIGTVITITGWDRVTKKLVLEHIETIDRAGMTQTAAVSRIIHLNERWNPVGIYVDAGFGGMQIEQLRLYGSNNPRSGIYEKLKPITMNSKIQVVDPASGMVLDKHAKEFIIDMSARELEEGRIMLPKSEDNYEGEYGLVGQMRNFKVDKFTESGHRKFSDGKDHAIVAWALSITAMALEFEGSGLASGFIDEIKGRLAGLPSPYRPGEAIAGAPNGLFEDERQINPDDLNRERAAQKEKARTTPSDRENITDARDDLPIRNESVKIYDVSKNAGNLKKRMAPPKRKLW